MAAYYNEHDPKAAAWLRELIARGLIAPGEVDERSIIDVRADDLRGFEQCHFFAGVGVWSYALRCAGWADGRSVWTGSCPCQPFSAAGKGNEFGDERHLWPAWFRLIRECRPVVVFGEQVSSKVALTWFDHVCADLEGEGYAIGALDTCAASVGAPHIRQRLYFVADSSLVQRECGEHNGRSHREMLGCVPEFGDGRNARISSACEGGMADDDERGRSLVGASRLHGDGEPRHDATRRGAGGVAVAADERRERSTTTGRQAGNRAQQSGVMDDAIGTRSQGHERSGDVGLRRGAEPLRPTAEAGATNGFWRGAEWLRCRDGKARAIESGVEPLVDGAPARVVRLRGYGNAIVAPVAQAFIESYIEVSEAA
jgi:DNA (cytosine-5)-methyltransferase 1